MSRVFLIQKNGKKKILWKIKIQKEIVKQKGKN